MAGLLSDKYAPIIDRLLKWQRNFKVTGAAYWKNDSENPSLAIIAPKRPPASASTPVSAVVAVSLSNPTGDPGRDTTTCALTYDIADYFTGVAIATGVAMDGHGQRIALTIMDAGTIGLAVFKDSAWKLIWADEIPETGICANVVFDGGTA
jgi:hypothetical protein